MMGARAATRSALVVARYLSITRCRMGWIVETPCHITWTPQLAPPNPGDVVETEHGMQTVQRALFNWSHGLAAWFAEQRGIQEAERAGWS